MNTTQLSRSFWQMSNVIVGFAAVQSITFGCAIFDGRVHGLQSWIVKGELALMIVIGYIVYAVGSCWCGWQAICTAENEKKPSALTPAEKRVMVRANWGRFVSILFFGVVGILDMYLF